jgi:hypothetical protein
VAWIALGVSALFVIAGLVMHRMSTKILNLETAVDRFVSLGKPHEINA